MKYWNNRSSMSLYVRVRSQMVPGRDYEYPCLRSRVRRTQRGVFRATAIFCLTITHYRFLREIHITGRPDVRRRLGAVSQRENVIRRWMGDQRSTGEACTHVFERLQASHVSDTRYGSFLHIEFNHKVTALRRPFVLEAAILQYT